eukprot:1726165-Pyramimonas_sp.AAC.1
MYPHLQLEAVQLLVLHLEGFGQLDEVGCIQRGQVQLRTSTRDVPLDARPREFTAKMPAHLLLDNFESYACAFHVYKPEMEKGITLLTFKLGVRACVCVLG